MKIPNNYVALRWQFHLMLQTDEKERPVLSPVAITMDNFQQIILEDSKSKWLLLQFFVPENQACAQTTQILSTAVQPYAQHLTYAQVNCNEQQQIAQQFGIQSVPTVMLIKDAQPVDGFASVLDAAQVEEFLVKHLPRPEDELLIAAQEQLNAGDIQGAFTSAQQAYALAPNNLDCQYMLADCQIDLGQIDAAKALLSSIGLADQDNRYQVLQGKIELALQAAESPEIKALQAQLAEEPENKQIKVDLAVQLHAAHQTEDALALLFSVVSEQLDFGEAKKLLLDMINALPDGDALKSSYRRKVYSLLY